MSRQMNRREFIRNTGAISFGAWALSSNAMGWTGSPNDKLNVAAVGVGGRGHGDLNGVASENILALVDVDRRTLDKTGNDFPKANKYQDWRKMLDKEKLDAVVCATPDHNHAIISHNAMELGYHVYCEKPLTRTIHEARAVAEIAKKKKLATQMGNQGHSNPGVRRIVAAVRGGTIGAVREAHCWTDRPGGWWPQGVDRPKDRPAVPGHLDWDVWLGPSPSRPYHPAYHPFRWRGWWDFGTGALGDMACHVMDGAFWSLNLTAPTSVEATGAPHKPESGPIWETITFEFPARGDMPPVKLTWYDGNRNNEPNRPPADLAPGEDLKRHGNGTLFVGEKGTILVPDAYCNAHTYLPNSKDAEMKAQEPAPSIPSSPGHHRQWIEACKNGTMNDESGSHFGYAGPMTEAILLGVVAFRLREKIEWDAANMKVTNNSKAAELVEPKYRKGWTL